MKTGLTKRQKTTCIYFDEASKTVEIQTHNTALKKRLTQYAAAYPNLCRQTDDDEQGGLTFEIDRRRFGIRLTAPYSAERRQATSELAKKNGLKGRVYAHIRYSRPQELRLLRAAFSLQRTSHVLGRLSCEHCRFVL